MVSVIVDDRHARRPGNDLEAAADAAEARERFGQRRNANPGGEADGIAASAFCTLYAPGTGKPISPASRPSTTSSKREPKSRYVTRRACSRLAETERSRARRARDSRQRGGAGSSMPTSARPPAGTPDKNFSKPRSTSRNRRRGDVIVSRRW